MILTMARKTTVDWTNSSMFDPIDGVGAWDGSGTGVNPSSPAVLTGVLRSIYTLLLWQR